LGACDTCLMSETPGLSSLGSVLRQARADHGLSLRAVEGRTGIKSGHLSQIETGAIARPDLAILWDLADLYGLDFDRLMALAGLGSASGRSGLSRQRMTVALRALRDLAPHEQEDVISYIAALRTRRERR
jgi:HTH-type transcriptional regulator, competence development regulator